MSSAEHQGVEAPVMGEKWRSVNFHALKSGPWVSDTAASFAMENTTTSRCSGLGYCIETQNQRSDADYQIVGYEMTPSEHVVEYCRPTEDAGGGGAEWKCETL